MTVKVAAAAEVVDQVLTKAGPRAADPDQAPPRPFEIMLELAIGHLHTGSSLLDAPSCVESVWGDGHQSLWAKGEPLVVYGPEGVGKTTLDQQLALKIIGIGEPSLLGFTVHGPRRVLYVAADRPAQVWRSFRRMVGEEDRQLLDEGLALWRGPLPFDLATEPDALLTLARRAGAEVVFLDSLKDVAANLPKDETGVGLNRAFQICCTEGVDVAGLHHPRKEQPGAGKPRHLADLYGSRWIGAGAGSVVLLWGEAGDPVVELEQLKQPDETIGPLTVVHDHIRGVSSVVERLDAFTVVLNSPKGATAADVAEALFGQTDRNSKEKAKNRLERLHNEGRIHREDGTRGGAKGGTPARYYSMSLLRQGDSDGE